MTFLRARLRLLCAIPLCLCACGGMRVPPAGQPTRGTGGRIVTRAEIERSGARSAWDALRVTLPGLSLRESRIGTPLGIGRHGRASIYLSSEPLVIVDFVRVTDIRLLRDIGADDVMSIELLNGIDATTYHGTNAGSGVILVRTRGTFLPHDPASPPDPPPTTS